jgi:hypothetical protein
LDEEALVKRKYLILILLLLLITTSTLALAQVDELGIPWFSIDSGASSIRGGDFLLKGVIGQPDAGVLSGGDFALVGGFGIGVSSTGAKQVYLPLITR